MVGFDTQGARGRLWGLALVTALLGCNKAERPAAAPPPPAAVPVGAAPVAVAPDAGSAAGGAPSGGLTGFGGTPAELYGACRERVELPETPGECQSDADCVRSGCSQELCIAASQTDIMSTCEVRPCFSVLGSCGCQDGLCSWTLAEVPTGGAPPPGVPIQLPPKPN